MDSLKLFLIIFSCSSRQISLSSALLIADLPQFNELVVSYFHFQGVQSIQLVVCPKDKQCSAQRKELQDIARHLMKSGFYVHVVQGDKFIDQPKQKPFGPPITFHSNNSTRSPIDFSVPSLHYKVGVLMFHLNSVCALNVLSWASASENNFFKTNAFWLVVAEKKNGLLLLEDPEIFIPPDSEMRVLIYNPLVHSYELIDVYKIAANKGLKMREVGSNIGSKEVLEKNLLEFGSAISYRQNLEGYRLETSLVIAFPDLFTNIEDLSLRHVDSIAKVNHRLCMELANRLNLSLNTHQTDNFGWSQPNGSFDGVMGQFQRYELDFAQMAMFMRLDRLALVSFVAETFHIRAGLMFRQPALSAVANIFALPFETDVWISILALLICTTCILFVEMKLSPFHHNLNFWDCFLFVWGALCQQGFYVTVGNRAARIIIFTTFVATLFIFTSFSANIVALLQSPSEAIKNLEDLSQSVMEIGVQDTVYNKIFFNESTDPITKQFYLRKISGKGDKVFMRPPIGIEKMRLGFFAYQVELQSGYQIISDTFNEAEKCGIREIEPFQLPMLAFPTRKNFPYKELFRRQLRWQREVGLMKREELKWFPQKPECESGMGGFVSVGLTDCRFALALFGYGVLIAFIFFLFEVLHQHLVTWIRNQ